MLRRILFLSILLCMVIPAFAKKTARPLPTIKAEYFITCKQNKCRPCLDYAQLEKLRFISDEGEYDLYRRDVDIAGYNNEEFEIYKVLLDFKSTAAADAFMKTFDELWKDGNGFKELNFKSAGKDKNDLCVQRTGNKVWISYLHILQK